MAQQAIQKAATMTGLDIGMIVMDPNEVISPDVFAKIPGWKKLSDDEKDVVEAEGSQLARAMMTFGYSRLAIGSHLAKVQKVLEPHSVFGKFLKTFSLSRRTAYRFIRKFENASVALPEAVLK